MILSNFSLDEQKRIRFVHVVDVYNDEKWVKQVKSLVNGVIEPNSKVGLIGHFKDESSYYLRLFPEWVMVELDSLKDRFLPLQCVKPTIRAKLKRMHFPKAPFNFFGRIPKYTVIFTATAKVFTGRPFKY
ncbi:hypothetical protein AB3538_09510 [Acinetobacter baumannii]